MIPPKQPYGVQRSVSKAGGQVSRTQVETAAADADGAGTISDEELADAVAEAGSWDEEVGPVLASPPKLGLATWFQ